LRQNSTGLLMIEMLWMSRLQMMVMQTKPEYSGGSGSLSLSLCICVRGRMSENEKADQVPAKDEEECSEAVNWMSCQRTTDTHQR
jgi:hypothetical protein